MNRKLSLTLVVGLVMLGLGYFGGPGGASILDFGLASAQNTKSGSLPGQDNPKSKIQNPNLVGPLAPLTAVGSSFAYQGRLNDGSAPANASYDLTFKLFDALNGGNQVGSTYPANAVMVTGGLFTVLVSFGDTAFLGETRYLEVAVRLAGAGNFTTLYPRQPIMPAPYANSVPWFGVSGKPTGYSPLRAANSISTPDTGGASNSAGQHTAMTIGADGLPIISYYYTSTTTGSLKVAHCSDLACASATYTIIDNSATDVGQYSAITIGTDGLAIISYYDATNHRLKAAHCGNQACTSATPVIVDSTTSSDVGQYTSVTIGSDGLPLIAYYDVFNHNLQVAHCGNVTCTLAARTLSTLDSGGVVGQYTSVAVGADGLPLISYYDATLGPSGGNLNVAHCGDAACTSVITTTLDATGDVGRYTSIATGADGLGLISYYDASGQRLKVAHCNVVTCTAATAITPFDTGGNVGQYTSVNIGADGLALISYYDVTNGNLKVAHCANQACTNATISTVDGSANDVGKYASMTIGADGLPVIGYYDATAGVRGLKALHCASPLCVSYQRRR